MVISEQPLKLDERRVIYAQAAGLYTGKYDIKICVCNSGEEADVTLHLSLETESHILPFVFTAIGAQRLGNALLQAARVTNITNNY
jgi:uncharacterized protein VirK/YbjX